MEKSKNRVVVFTDTNAIVLTNPPNIDQYKNKSYCIINPDLSAVEGIEQHFWKNDGGSVLPMSQHERNERRIKLQGINEHFIDQWSFTSTMVDAAESKAAAEQRLLEAKHKKAALLLKVGIGASALAGYAIKYFGLV